MLNASHLISSMQFQCLIYNNLKSVIMEVTIKYYNAFVC